MTAFEWAKEHAFQVCDCEGLGLQGLTVVGAAEESGFDWVLLRASEPFTNIDSWPTHVRPPFSGVDATLGLTGLHTLRSFNDADLEAILALTDCVLVALQPGDLTWQVTTPKQDDRFPHTCPVLTCAAPAYVGVTPTAVDCSRPKCKHYQGPTVSEDTKEDLEKFLTAWRGVVRPPVYVPQPALPPPIQPPPGTPTKKPPFTIPPPVYRYFPVPGSTPNNSPHGPIGNPGKLPAIINPFKTPVSSQDP